MDKNKNNNQLGAIILGLITLYLAWGSTYLAIHVLIQKCPPIIASGARNLAAGLVLFVFLIAKGGLKKISTKNWVALGISGILMLSAGNGFLTMAAAWVPTGYMSLFPAMVPGILVLFELFDGKKPNLITIIGLVLGFVGLYFLVNENSLKTPQNAENFGLGVIFLILASVAWSSGVFYSVKNNTGLSTAQVSSFQMMIGGLCSCILAAFLGEFKQLNISSFETETWLAFIYLLAIGSIVGLMVFNWLSTKASPTLVSTYSYVNPLVAIILGILFLNESLTKNMGIATLLIVVAVILITFGTKPKSKS